MKIKFVKANRALNVSTSAMFLALGVLFPLLFHAVGLGSQFSPMHLPVLLAGMICGPLSGLIVGFLAPFISSLVSGMPPVFPMAVAMAFELAVYGFVAGLLMCVFSESRNKTLKNLNIVLSLLVAMMRIRSGHVDSDRNSRRPLYLRSVYRRGASRLVAGLALAASCGARGHVRFEKRAHT